MCMEHSVEYKKIGNVIFSWRIMSNVSVNLSVFYLFDSLVTYCSSCSRDLDFRLTVFGLIRIPRPDQNRI